MATAANDMDDYICDGDRVVHNLYADTWHSESSATLATHSNWINANVNVNVSIESVHNNNNINYNRNNTSMKPQVGQFTTIEAIANYLKHQPSLTQIIHDNKNKRLCYTYTSHQHGMYRV